MPEIDIIEWCENNISLSYRKRENKSGRYTEIIVYCCKKEYLLLMEQFGKYVIEHGKPFDDTAADYLRQGIDLELRDHLFYNKYRYSVKMIIRDYTKFDVFEWAISNMGVDKERYTITHGLGNPYFYIKSEIELMQLSMALGDYIKSITRIYLEDEVVKLIQ